MHVFMKYFKVTYVLYLSFCIFIDSALELLYTLFMQTIFIYYWFPHLRFSFLFNYYKNP